MQPTNSEKIKQEFKALRTRQLTAIGVTLALLLLIALLYNHTHILEGFAKNDILSAQILILCVFIGFSSYNWKCPSCNRYIGPDINRRICKHCGARLR